MNRHDFIRRQIILDEMETEEDKQETKKGNEPADIRSGCAKGVRLLGPDDEGWS